MNIRVFKKEDTQAVVDLWLKCQLVVPWNNPVRDIERKLKVDADLFLVGEEEGQIIGSVMCGYEGHRSWVNYLAVNPDFRQKGYGRQLMEAAEKGAKEKGAPKIQLQIRATNTAVIEFYKSIGYKEDKVLSFGKRLEHDKPIENKD